MIHKALLTLLAVIMILVVALGGLVWKDFKKQESFVGCGTVLTNYNAGSYAIIKDVEWVEGYDGYRVGEEYITALVENRVYEDNLVAIHYFEDELRHEAEADPNCTTEPRQVWVPPQGAKP